MNSLSGIFNILIHIQYIVYIQNIYRARKSTNIQFPKSHQTIEQKNEKLHKNENQIIARFTITNNSFIPFFTVLLYFFDSVFTPPRPTKKHLKEKTSDKQTKVTILGRCAQTAFPFQML